MNVEIYSLASGKTVKADSEINFSVSGNFLNLKCSKNLNNDIVTFDVEMSFANKVELLACLDHVYTDIYLKKDYVFFHCLDCEIKSVESLEALNLKMESASEAVEHLAYYLRERANKEVKKTE